MKADKRKNVTTEIAYLAGFFDGEGCVRIKKAYNGSKACWVTVQISNTDAVVLADFERLFGGSVFTRGRSKNFKMYMWELSSTEAVDFLRCISGFLRGKRDQALYAISFHENMRDMNKEQRHSAHDELSKMKKSLSRNIHQHPELLPQSTE